MPLSTPASKRLSAALGLSIIVLGAYFYGLNQHRQLLYCLERPGQVWNGLFPVPLGMEQQCPASDSYRQEVRQGLSRVEQYRLPGWQPQALMQPLKQAGYVLLEDELTVGKHYSVFLGRTVPAELFYTAIPEGGETVITLSGK